MNLRLTESKIVTNKSENISTKSHEFCAIQKQLEHLEEEREQDKIKAVVVASFFAVVSFFFLFFVGIPFIAHFLSVALDGATARSILKEYIPKDVKHHDLETDVIIPVFDFKNLIPKLYYKGSPDLNSKMFTLLDTVIAGVADPYVYQPVSI